MECADVFTAAIVENHTTFAKYNCFPAKQWKWWIILHMLFLFTHERHQHGTSIVGLSSTKQNWKTRLETSHARNTAMETVIWHSWFKNTRQLQYCSLRMFHVKVLVFFCREVNRPRAIPCCSVAFAWQSDTISQLTACMNHLVVSSKTYKYPCITLLPEINTFAA